MTYTEFQQLQKKEQSKLVLCKGKQLSKRETASYDIVLYELFNFCVELRFHKPSNSIIGCSPIVFN